MSTTACIYARGSTAERSAAMQLEELRASWATICRETRLSKGTAQRAVHRLPKKFGEACGQIVNSVDNPSDILRHTSI